MTFPSPVSRTATVVRSFGTDNGASQQLTAAPAHAQRISVERCVAELRAGRPVRVRSGTELWLATAAESALNDPTQLESFRSVDADTRAVARLVLPFERLHYLGVAMSGPGATALAALTNEQVGGLVLDRAVPELPAFSSAPPVSSAALDLMKFAQLVPAAIVVECTDQTDFDWTLEVTVDALRNFHHEVAHTLTLAARAPVPLLDDADAEFVVFRGTDGLKDQVAIVVGQPDANDAVPIRLHSACLTGDLFGSLKCDCGEQLRRAVQSFAESGGGVLLYLDQEGRGIGLGNKMRAYALQSDGYDTVDADAVIGYGADERRYEIAAQMVALLGYKRVSLLTNNPRKIAALSAQGIEVADRIALVGTVNPHNERYLKAKVERSGHLGAGGDADN